MKYAAAALLILLLLAGSWVWYAYSSAKRDLAEEVAHVRRIGAPLTTVDLQQLYKPEAGLPDITAELEKVLLIADNKELEDALLKVRKFGDALKPPRNGEPWPELAEIEGLLARYEELLTYAHSLPNREFTTRFPYDLTLGIIAPTPHTFRVFHCTHILGLQLRVDLYHGQTAAAVDRLLQQLAMADTLRHEPNAFSQFMRIAMIRLVIENLEFILGQADVAEQDLARMQVAFQKLDIHGSLRFTIRAERASAYTLTTWPIESLAAIDGDEKLSKKEYIERNLARGPRYPWDAAVLLKSFRRLDDAAVSSVHDAVQEWGAVAEDCKARIKRAKRSYPYSSLLLPPFALTMGQFATADAQCQAAPAAIAAVRFQRKQQRWPANWQELVPEYLPAAPQDPYSAKDMLFVTSTNSLKIYSVGENRADDGGRWGDGEFADVGLAIELR